MWEGPYKKVVTDVLAGAMRGTVVAIAGLFFGDWLPVLSRAVGDAGVVFGFEPTQHVKQAKATSNANGVRNARLTNGCLSDAPTPLTMCVRAAGAEQRLGGMSRVVDARASADQAQPAACAESISVPCFTLDAALPWREREVSFLLLDVEGHESAALSGGLAMIHKWKPLLALEQRLHNLNVAKNLTYAGYTLCEHMPGHANELFFFCNRHNQKHAAWLPQKSAAAATGAAPASPTKS